MIYSNTEIEFALGLRRNILNVLLISLTGYNLDRMIYKNQKALYQTIISENTI